MAFFCRKNLWKTEFDVKNKAPESEYKKKRRNSNGNVGIGMSENRNLSKLPVGMSESMTPPQSDCVFPRGIINWLYILGMSVFVGFSLTHCIAELTSSFDFF